MSSNLSNELSSLRTTVLTAKDDIELIRNIYEPDALATVLGSAKEAGFMDVEHARVLCSEHNVLGTLLESCTDQQAAKEAVAGLMARSAALASERVRDEAIKLVQTDLASRLEAQVDALKKHLDKISTQSASIISEAEARANVVSAARADALRTYNSSWVKIEEAASVIKGFDVRMSEINAQSAELALNTSLSIGEMSTGSDDLDKVTKFIKYQRDITISKLAENFGDRKVNRASTSKVTLSIPANLDTSKGKQAIDNIRLYVKTLSEQFAFIMAELERTDSDYDQKTQSYYKPPSIPAEIAKIPVNSRELYTADASTLYDEVWAKLSPNTQARLKGTFNYGFGASKLTGTVSIGDGVTLVFALICMFRNCVGVESEIKTLFILAEQGFQKHPNPMVTVDNLRNALSKAADLNTSMEWSETGAKMVEQLCHDDHNMAKALEKFTDIQPADNQTVGLITDMFAIIDRQCSKQTSRDDKQGTKRACVASALDTLGINNTRHTQKRDKAWAECRNGTNCTRQGCKFTHSGQKSTVDGKQMFDNSNKSGGRCEALNCPATGEKKRLCTTCFRALLTDGSIRAKNGPPIKKHELSRSRPDNFYPKYENNNNQSNNRKRSANTAGIDQGRSLITHQEIKNKWKSAGKKARKMGDEATIEGKAGPKSVKMAAAKAAADGEDIEGYNEWHSLRSHWWTTWGLTSMA